MPSNQARAKATLPPWTRLALVCVLALGNLVLAEHWAFQPIQTPRIPRLKASAENSGDRVHPVDAFIRQSLSENGLHPSPPADRRTLIRRATFDLAGLPPAPGEIEAFLADNAPGAFERVVDRLLASPRYGERWGRHWLDVARYSDTKGYVRLKDNPNYVGAWTYRDYVIRAFNEDKPYDRFLLEQIAADHLASGEDRRDLAAMGFLTLGQRFINSQPDIIDDRIDVVTRGLLGLSVACARCHDHKFDPIPMRDYYSLYGVFENSVEPRVPPLAAGPLDLPAGYAEQFNARKRKLEDFLQAQRASLHAGFLKRAAEYLLAAQAEKVQANFLAAMFLVDAKKDLNPVMTHRLALFMAATRARPHPVMETWHALARLPQERFEHDWKKVLADPARISPNPVLTRALQAKPPSNLADVAEVLAGLLRESERRIASSRENRSANPSADAAWDEIATLVYGPEAPFEVPLGELEEHLYVDTTTQNELHEHQRQVEDWISAKGLAPHAHTLVDADTLKEPRVFKRGNASNPGETVPRQFLAALSKGTREPFQHGSGRLDLARAIADRANPLTARVMVNRVWMHHFGAGLVRTPGDFGTRGDLPTHPGLLDYLAARFMEEGWSVKALHRMIMLSATYQQGSGDSIEASKKDPQNTLLWRAHRRRIEWEAMRDAFLSASGSLDSKMGGPSVSLTGTNAPPRRTVYGLVDRQNLSSVYRTFDFATPDACAVQRHQTAVSPQSLYLMNHPFVWQQAVSLARRVETLPGLEAKVHQLHLLLYGRRASPEEIALAADYLRSPAQGEVRDAASENDRSTLWAEYAQALLLANECVFID